MEQSKCHRQGWTAASQPRPQGTQISHFPRYAQEQPLFVRPRDEISANPNQTRAADNPSAILGAFMTTNRNEHHRFGVGMRDAKKPMNAFPLQPLACRLL
jgi:hypothetical protein